MRHRLLFRSALLLILTYLSSCGAPSSRLLPQASLPPPDYREESGITVSSPDESGSVTITGAAEMVPVDGTIIVTVGEDSQDMLGQDLSEEQAFSSAAGCFANIPSCPQIDVYNRCQQLPSANGSFTAQISAGVASKLKIAIYDQQSCEELVAYKVQVEAAPVTASLPTEAGGTTPALPVTTGDTESVEIAGYSDDDSANYSEEDGEDNVTNDGTTTASNDIQTTDSTTATAEPDSQDSGSDMTSRSGPTTLPDDQTESASSSDSTSGESIASGGSTSPVTASPASEPQSEPLSGPAPTPLAEPTPTPAPVTLVESIFHAPNLDRYKHPVMNANYLGGLYLATILPDGTPSPNKLVTFRGSALMRVSQGGIDPGIKFTLTETQTIYACGPLVKPDLAYDRAFIVRNSLPNLWQGAELFMSDNYNPTRSPPDVPTRMLGLGEIAKQIGLAGVQQIRVIPYVDSVKDEVVMVVGTQIPGQLMRYYLVTTERRSGYCSGIIPTSVTFIAETNNPVRAAFITEKYSNSTLREIIRVDEPINNRATFIDLDSLDVEIGEIPPQPLRSDALLPQCKDH